MSVRESVLRLHRWRLQERQDYLAGLESLLQRLRGDARRLQDETSGNGYRADDGGAYSPLVRALIERRRRLEGSMLEIEAQIAEARTAVNEAMQEVRHAEYGMASGEAHPHVTRRSRRARALPNRPRLTQ